MHLIDSIDLTPAEALPGPVFTRFRYKFVHRAFIGFHEGFSNTIWASEQNATGKERWELDSDVVEKPGNRFNQTGAGLIDRRLCRHAGQPLYRRAATCPVAKRNRLMFPTSRVIAASPLKVVASRQPWGPA